MTTLMSGARLGAFEVVEKLGEGGMGAVYRARDTRLHRDVAIKMLLPAIAADPDRLARFEREAQVLAALNHPNIASIYGIESAAASTALVLEFVDGPTLADRIARGPLPLDDALAIAAQIADALAAAHDQGIVHRDLKPANVKLRADGTVKVLDFGLAKALDSDSAVVTGSAAGGSLATMSAHVTTAGMILGTAAYMSPEQASGKPVDKRTDIWAFGVVVWEMLTGRRLFDGETTSHVLAAVLTQEPDLSGVPPRVARLLARCLERDPKRRLRDIGDALSLVDGAATVRRDRPALGWPVVAAWAVAGSLAVALGAVIWLRPADVADAVDRPAVRFPVPRPSVDPYNNAVTAFSLSPDGRYLAYYTSTADGRAILSLQTLATGERREIPGSVVLSPNAPFWSPDSRYVVFTTNVAASVFDLITATTRPLCACRFRGGTWNRDGVILLGSSPNGSDPIQRVSLEDSVPVAVTTVDATAGEVDTEPVFLPDGERFVFTRTRAGSRPNTFLASLGGAPPARIADGSRTVFPGIVGGPSYLLGIEAAGLMAQAIDLDTMTPTAPPVLVVAGAAAATVSANGVLATAAPAGRPVTQAVWRDRTGKEAGVVGAPGAIVGVALAPGGRIAALVEIAREGGSNVWLRDGRGVSRRLTPAGGDAPVWSPDGASLVVSKRQGRATALFKRATDGSGHEQQMWSGDRNAFANDWSRDGKWLIFTLPNAERNLDLDLWVAQADGNGELKPEPYLTSADREAQAEFSPDGRFVAYTSMSGGDPEVYVQPFPDASGGRWLVSSGGGAEPHWSGDGKELFYIAGRTMMAVPITLQPTFSAGPPRPLFEAAVQPWFTNDTDRTQVAPDGQRFLLLVDADKTPPPPIDIVVNWTTLLRK